MTEQVDEGVLRKFLEDNKTQTTSGNGGWTAAAIAGILVLIVTAVLGYLAWRKGRELAKLQHEQAVREEEAHQHEIDIHLAENEAKRQEAMHKMDAAQLRIETIDKELVKVEEDRRAIISKIDSITDWSGVDKYLGRT